MSWLQVASATAQQEACTAPVSNKPVWRGGDSGWELPAIGGQEVKIQHVSIDAHAIQDLRDSCDEYGEHGGGGMVHAQAGLAQCVPGLHRFSPLGH